MNIKALEQQAIHNGNYVAKINIKLHKKDKDKLTKRCEKFRLDRASILRGLINQYLTGESALTSTIGETRDGENVVVRLTASQYKELQEKCAKEKRKPTAVLRTMVIEYLHVV